MHVEKTFLSTTFTVLCLCSVFVQHVQCEVDANFAQESVQWSEIEESRSIRYTPDWTSLDKRPLPSWYDEAKIGIFIHFGVFAVPSFGKGTASEWFWQVWKLAGNKDVIEFMEKNYPPSFQYGDFAAQFTTEFYDADHWAELFEASGARYVVLTSKHHEGFTNWPSKYSFNWNSMDVGPKRDIVGELAAAVKKKSLHFGLYHSMYEWFNPLYLNDKANKFSTQDFVMTKTLPELYEIVNKYKPEVIWSDGDWEASYNYWNSTNFLAWLFNDSPVKDTVVVNDRWGVGTECKHGSFYNCHDRFNPGKLFNHKWENAMTIDKQSWGFRRNALLSDYLTMNELLTVMAETISCGGNLLVNVGPTKEGTISPIFESRLREMGAWLKVNGEAIYGSQPWTHQNDTVTPGVWYTSKKSPAGGYDVYAIVLSWPTKDQLELGAVKSPPSDLKVTMLGYSDVIQWSKGAAGDLVLRVPAIPANQMPCQHAWVFKMEGIASF